MPGIITSLIRTRNIPPVESLTTSNPRMLHVDLEIESEEDEEIRKAWAEFVSDP